VNKLKYLRNDDECVEQGDPPAPPAIEPFFPILANVFGH
jgi:hypothetical protein